MMMIILRRLASLSPPPPPPSRWLSIHSRAAATIAAPRRGGLVVVVGSRSHHPKQNCFYTTSSPPVVLESAAAASKTAKSLLEVGTEHWGIVTSTKRFGVFVRLEDYPNQDDGLIPNEYLVHDGGGCCEVGDRIRVVILPERVGVGKLRFSMKRRQQQHQQQQQDGSSDDDYEDEFLTMEDLEIHEDYWGTVEKVMDFGAFVRIDGCSFDGLVHARELSREYDRPDPNLVVQQGDRVRVQVLAPGRNGRLALSMKRARRKLSEDFNPVTVAVFNLPYEMSSPGELTEHVFQQYGEVLDIRLLPAYSPHDENRRQLTFVTFEEMESARLAMKNLRKVSMQIGSETYEYDNIHVKLAHEQNFKEQLQQRLDEEDDAFLQELLDNQDPSDRRLKRLADRHVRDIIPYYDDF